MHIHAHIHIRIHKATHVMINYSSGAALDETAPQSRHIIYIYIYIYIHIYIYTYYITT